MKESSILSLAKADEVLISLAVAKLEIAKTRTFPM